MQKIELENEMIQQWKEQQKVDNSLKIEQRKLKIEDLKSLKEQEKRVQDKFLREMLVREQQRAEKERRNKISVERMHQAVK